MSVIGTRCTIIIALPTALSHMYITVIESPIQIRASSWRPERVATLYRFSLSPYQFRITRALNSDLIVLLAPLYHTQSYDSKVVRHEDRFLIGLKIVEDCRRDKNYFYFPLNGYYIFL